MGLLVNDGFINTFDYTVDFNLNTKIVTVTDASTYADTTGVTIAATITTPNGIVLSFSFAANGSDTATIPSINGGVVYGFYAITATATDSVSAYTLAKSSQNICKPLQCTTTKNSDGCLTSSVRFLCSDNKLLYQDNTSYVYQSTTASSVTKSVTLVDPNNVTQVSAADVSSFTVTPIVNGKYSLTVENEAVYDFGSGVTVTITYKANNQPYTAACDINLCDLRCAMEQIYTEWKAENGSGSVRERTLKDKWTRLAFLAWDAESGIACGDDVSSIIEEIEELSGVECSCGCGTTNPNSIICSCNEVVVEAGTGISVEQTTAGSTTTITVTNSLPETYKVKADAADTAADYLENKIESSDSFLTVGYDAATDKVDLTATPLVWNNMTAAGTWAINTRLEYSKDAQGNVRIRGSIIGDSAAGINTLTVALPVGYRPAVIEYFPTTFAPAAVTQATALRFSVGTGGVITAIFSGINVATIVPLNCEFNVN